MIDIHIFWHLHGIYFLYTGFSCIVIIFFLLPFYTGSAKKLDLIAKDIEKYGAPQQATLDFDKFFNNQNLDLFRLSTITYIFYKVPSKAKKPVLYKNVYFYKQLKKILIFRVIYKVLFLFFVLDFGSIGVLVYFFGDNI